MYFSQQEEARTKAVKDFVHTKYRFEQAMGETTLETSEDENHTRNEWRMNYTRNEWEVNYT